MKASSSRTRFPGRAGDPERQHHAAVMTTTIARVSSRNVSSGFHVPGSDNDLPCHGASVEFSLNRTDVNAVAILAIPYLSRKRRYTGTASPSRKVSTTMYSMFSV